MLIRHIFGHVDTLVDLRRLQTFVTVSEQGTVSKAASLLHITQPALSRQLRDLQDELGIKLFERVGRRLLLTGEGDQFLTDCRGLLSHAASIRERAQSLRSSDTGVLKVAASPQMIENVFPSFLRHYAARYPGVQVRPIEAPGIDHPAMLERGDVRLAISVIRVDDERFGSYLLPPLNVLAVWHSSLRLGRTRDIDVRRLADRPLLLVKSSFATRKVFDAACRLEHLEPSVFIESGAAPTLIGLAKAGHGVAIVPSTVRIDLRKLRVACLSCRNKHLQVQLAVIWEKRRPLPRYAASFFETFAAHLREIFPFNPLVAASLKKSIGSRRQAREEEP
jgi:DNA-binding transcriptional LysR family regulator